MKFEIPPLLLHFNFLWNNNWHSSERKETKNSLKTGFQSTEWNTSRHLVAQRNRRPRDDDEYAWLSWTFMTTTTNRPANAVVARGNEIQLIHRLLCWAELRWPVTTWYIHITYVGDLHWLLCASTYIPYCIGMPVCALEVGSQTNRCYNCSGIWYWVIMLSIVM